MKYLKTSVIIFSSLIFSLISSILMTGCGEKTQPKENEGEILLEIGDSVIYKEEIERLIPYGLVPEDSVALFHQIIDSRVESILLEDLAKENVIDLERIDRLTQTYRNRLIIEEYLRKMEEGASTKANDKEIDRYYAQYGDSMILTQPLVKGIYLRTTSGDDRLPDIRQWVKSASQGDVDQLEKKGLREATGYEYFADRWVEWSAIAEQLPVRVKDADLFLKENKEYEIERGGTVYLLHVSDFIPSGEKMPEAYAKSKISEILTDKHSGEYRSRLKESIYRRAIEDGKMKPGTYNPFTGLK
ncbi:MAG: hypothetical protein K2J03_03370 [Muribaculaceae bacterium]|nr:hypothetical protein [Muribaculaceae bacterium]